MSDWNENKLGEMPCKPFDMVDVWFRDGDLSSGFASDFYWKIDHDIADVIKYKVRKNEAETQEENEAFDSMANGEKPASGQDVFIAQMNTLAGVESQRYFIHQYWCNSGHQNQLLELGILFTDKDKAIEKTKSLLGIPTETPQQREERERLGAAYDLYLAGNEHCGFNSAKSFDEFKNDGFQLDFWLTIVDKTSYRKAK